ncbi:hypothetical protein [Burkholderia paludis]|uniref:hypothetical protein n=1 Tax=Burkholderia paludis TaxID=1506587 RepID=UPI001378C715|nr:hypothetical protein [Burkholderia paludis]
MTPFLARLKPIAHRLFTNIVSALVLPAMVACNPADVQLPTPLSNAESGSNAHEILAEAHNALDEAGDNQVFRVTVIPALYSVSGERACYPSCKLHHVDGQNILEYGISPGKSYWSDDQPTLTVHPDIPPQPGEDILHVTWSVSQRIEGTSQVHSVTAPISLPEKLGITRTILSLTFLPGNRLRVRWLGHEREGDAVHDLAPSQETQGAWAPMPVTVKVLNAGEGEIRNLSMHGVRPTSQPSVDAYVLTGISVANWWGNGSFVAPREDGMFPEMGRIKAGTKQVPNVVREVEYEGGRGGFVNIAVVPSDGRSGGKMNLAWFEPITDGAATNMYECYRAKVAMPAYEVGPDRELSDRGTNEDRSNMLWVAFLPDHRSYVRITRSNLDAHALDKDRAGVAVATAVPECRMRATDERSLARSVSCCDSGLDAQW